MIFLVRWTLSRKQEEENLELNVVMAATILILRLPVCDKVGLIQRSNIIVATQCQKNQPSIASEPELYSGYQDMHCRYDLTFT